MPDGAGVADPSRELRIDLRFARALLLLALALVAIYGSDVARHVPVYGPLDEFFHTAYVQKIADRGHPPVVGRDAIILGLGQKAPTPFTTVIRGLDHPYDPTQGTHVTPVFPDGTVFPQTEAIQPPLYYVAMTPVALVVPWSQRVLVMRLFGTLFVMIAVLLLYLAVRVVSPHRPLAAGLAAAILGSMGGVTSELSQVQNDALLLPLCVATFWLLARDLRARHAGFALPVVAGATVVTQLIAAPAAALAVLTALWFDAELRAMPWRSLGALRRVAARIGAAAILVAPWMVFNLWEYHWFWPIARSGSGAATAPSTRNLGLLRHSVQLLQTAGLQVFSGLWAQLWPLRDNVTPSDLRPAPVLVLAAALAVIVSLRSGSAVRERLRLGYWAAVAVVSFVGVFVVLIANAISAGGSPDFIARYFVAFAAAYAAFVGTAVAGVSTSRPWVARGCATALALVLAWQLLDVAYPSLVG
jgi:hypothetical protein